MTAPSHSVIGVWTAIRTSTVKTVDFSTISYRRKLTESPRWPLVARAVLPRSRRGVSTLKDLGIAAGSSHSLP
jgi:hypothetical protein